MEGIQVILSIMGIFFVTLLLPPYDLSTPKDKKEMNENRNMPTVPTPLISNTRTLKYRLPLRQSANLPVVLLYLINKALFSIYSSQIKQRNIKTLGTV